MRPRTSKKIPPCPLGVDLVEIRRARSFLRAHQDHWGTAFSKEEVRFIRRGRRPHERLAILLAAKEAVFKALPGAWRGLNGSNQVRIFPKSQRPASLRLSYWKDKNVVVVQCVRHGKKVKNAVGPSRTL